MTLTLILTDLCNGRCSYCPQSRSSAKLPHDLALLALEKIVPKLDDGRDLTINFYGGEPLLERELIVSVLSRARHFFKKGAIHFAMTSNGILLDEAFLETLAPYSFDLIISHDGLWQEETRPGFPKKKNIGFFEHLLYAHAHVQSRYNCVCPPNQIKKLAENITFFRFNTNRPVHFTLDSISPWSQDELHSLDASLSEIRSMGLESACPELFGPRRNALFVCSSNDRMALDPHGFIWDCFQYYDLFCRYPKAGPIDRHRTGHIGMPDESLRDMLSHWPVCQPVSQQQCLAGSSPCLLCDQLQQCSQCPANGAYATGEIGRLPPWLCAMQRILQKHKKAPGMDSQSVASSFSAERS